MGVTNSHLPIRSRKPSQTTSILLVSSSDPPSAHYSPKTTSTSPSNTKADPLQISPLSLSNNPTSASRLPTSFPIPTGDTQTPLRIGYPYYGEVVALQTKNHRGSTRRKKRKAFSKVLGHVGFGGSLQKEQIR
ncbi:hypothetical protein OIDMADRAFT_56508 [Oidiodendron maius Zn]|uniref:Uncharacterized protein n=1 Tax=Oidiodendron maius (strain Zn) TaxID=913774 RepID=A0A0C3HAI5_OIDMZ|nr:hypothetical protein OIDMADRAFT_56508 [Oidiodendron maius Zn]